MPNDQRSGECAQGRVGKDVADETVVLHDRDLLVVKSGHAGRFLPTVLQRVERVVAEMCHVAPRCNYRDDATSFFHAFSTVGVRSRRGTGTFSHSHPTPWRLVDTLEP